MERCRPAAGDLVLYLGFDPNQALCYEAICPQAGCSSSVYPPQCQQGCQVQPTSILEFYPVGGKPSPLAQPALAGFDATYVVAGSSMAGPVCLNSGTCKLSWQDIKPTQGTAPNDALGEDDTATP